MSISLYAASVPAFRRALIILRALLDKADISAAERNFDSAVLVGARLAPDMRPLSFQVQTVTDRTKLGVSRLTGIAAPAWPDTETTMDELRARIDKALAFLDTVDEAAFEGAAERQIATRSNGVESTVSGTDYLLANVLPNLYFHVTTAYNILRHNGVPVGKNDYLGI